MVIGWFWWLNRKKILFWKQINLENIFDRFLSQISVSTLEETKRFAVKKEKKMKDNLQSQITITG